MRRALGLLEAVQAAGATYTLPLALMPCKSQSSGCRTLWNEKAYNLTAHNTRHVSKLFSNCTTSGSCLPSLHFADEQWLALKKSVQKACLIRGSILQRARGLAAPEWELSRPQNDALWCCAPAKDVSVITLCTKRVCCNRIWTEVLRCKLPIFSPANCKQAVETVSRGWRLPEFLREKKKNQTTTPCSKNNTRCKAALAETRRAKMRNQVPENVKASCPSVLTLCILQCWKSLWIAEFPESPSWFISNHAFF